VDLVDLVDLVELVELVESTTALLHTLTCSMKVDRLRAAGGCWSRLLVPRCR
jgi:hypothetical protein